MHLHQLSQCTCTCGTVNTSVGRSVRVECFGIGEHRRKKPFEFCYQIFTPYPSPPGFHLRSPAGHGGGAEAANLRGDGHGEVRCARTAPLDASWPNLQNQFCQNFLKFYTQFCSFSAVSAPILQLNLIRVLQHILRSATLSYQHFQI